MKQNADFQDGISQGKSTATYLPNRKSLTTNGIVHDSMFSIPQTNFKSAHLLNEMALIQFQSNRTVQGQFFLQAFKMLNFENGLIYCN